MKPASMVVLLETILQLANVGVKVNPSNLVWWVLGFLGIILGRAWGGRGEGVTGGQGCEHPRHTSVGAGLLSELMHARAPCSQGVPYP